MLPEPTHHVLDVDDRVVDDVAECDHQPGQHHRVDRDVHPREHESRADQGERDRRHADHGRPPLVEERSQHQDHQEGPDDHRLAEVVDRVLDERRGTEDRRIERDVGKGGTEIGDRCVEAGRDVRRVRPWQLLHDEEQAGRSLMTPSPINGGVSITTSATSAKDHVATAIDDRDAGEPALR